jgi:hypothetical protein
MSSDFNQFCFQAALMLKNNNIVRRMQNAGLIVAVFEFSISLRIISKIGLRNHFKQ